MKLIKKIKNKKANADLNLQWVMWMAVVIMIMAALFVFRDSVMGFIGASKNEVTTIYTGG